MARKILLLVSFVSLACFALVRSSDSPKDQVLQESQRLAAQHKYVDALRMLNRALSADPNDPVLTEEFKKYAQLYIVHEISTGYQRIDKNPHDIDAYLLISNAFWMSGNSTKAQEVLLEATRQNPRSAKLWGAIGNLEDLSGRPNEAWSAYQEAKHYELAQ